MTGLTALPSLMPTLIPWTFTSILLILAVLVVRKFTQNWLSSVNRYALWLVVLIRLLVPIPVSYTHLAVFRPLNLLTEGRRTAKIQKNCIRRGFCDLSRRTGGRPHLQRSLL